MGAKTRTAPRIQGMSVTSATLLNRVRFAVPRRVSLQSAPAVKLSNSGPIR